MFEVRERDGLARIGVLETAHGRVATPTLAPVVNPNRPIIPPRDLATRFGAQILITNAYILGKSPGRDAIVRDGLHRFLGFPGAVMTDSGAFQSHVYGDVDVTNAEVIAFQKAIHSDFGTMLDVFSEPGHDHNRAAMDVDETVRRAQEAVSLRGDMALVGAVQGGLHADLRTRCASEVRESGCLCPVCTSHSMEKIAAEETLLAEHNLHACFGAIREVRQAIVEGDLWGLAERRSRAHPALLDAVRELRRHNEFLEEFEPVSRHGALSYVGPETAHRPILHRFRRRLLERYTPPPAKGLLVFPEGGRPFTERLAHVVDQALQVADVHVAVKSVWGPVPLELDHVWPMCQTIVPEALDLEALEAAEVFFREWTAGAGFSFGLLWEGETTLDELRNRAPGARTVDWNTLRIRATADFQFGRGAADALLAGTVSYVISKNTGKIRNVHVNGEHVLSLRAEDGLFTLKAAGARRLSNAFSAPTLRIVVEEDAVPFHREGKNVFAKFVREADPEIRPGDEALVVSPHDELCAVAQATMNRREMLAFKRGVAAHVREGVPHAPSAPRR